MSVTRICLAVALSAALPRAATACICPPAGPPCQAVWNADAVFIGMVRSIETVVQDRDGRPHESRLVRFDVERGLLNAVTGGFEVYTGASGPACGYPFTVGNRYVVYAKQSPAGWSTGRCSRTRSLADGRDDIRYFETPAPSTGARVLGSVRHWQREPFERTRIDYGPLDGLVVSVTGAGFYRESVTRADGRFEIAALPVGPARITLRAPDGAAGSFDREIELRDPRACSEQNFEVTYASAASGRVIDVYGEPLAGAMVDAVAAELAGHLPEPFQSPVRTDERGYFTFRSLPPGDYVFGLNLTQRSSRERRGPQIFLPGTRRADEATVVRLKRGDRVELGVLRLPD